MSRRVTTAPAGAIRTSRPPDARPVPPERWCTRRPSDREERIDGKRNATVPSAHSPLSGRRSPRAFLHPARSASAPPPHQRATVPRLLRSAAPPHVSRLAAVPRGDRTHTAPHLRGRGSGWSPANRHRLRPQRDPAIPGPCRIGRCSWHRPPAAVARTSGRGSAVRQRPLVTCRAASYRAPRSASSLPHRRSLRVGSDSTSRQGCSAMRPRPRSGRPPRPHGPQDLRSRHRLPVRWRPRPPWQVQPRIPHAAG